MGGLYVFGEALISCAATLFTFAVAHQLVPHDCARRAQVGVVLRDVARRLGVRS
ncbi:hypothetical protein [Saccharothrix lopnurensis]|uniref:Uncharacterized protein n=1 Tax=Saccharothrix lopnurensis TaxID=1670621 RepID=A0ABW1PGS3_9PSEU